jgi:riboflavin kinase/FMN adenylyltransferase
MIFLGQNDTIEFPTAITVGMFDGLHLGHRKLIANLKESAGGLKTMIFTFRVADEAGSIYTNAEKELLLSKTGADYAYLQECTQEFYATDRDLFIRRLISRYNMQKLAAGVDFRFGKGAAGNSDYLLHNTDRFGYSVEIVPPVMWGEEKISSTRIRALISSGNVLEASRMLGDYYFITGRVEEGKRTGTSFGFPTANIKTPKLKPVNGVYATLTEVEGKTYRSVTNVGVRPTVSGSGIVNIETNIFDFNDKIYNEDIAVHFVDRIRGEIKFGSLEELKNQIERDKGKALEILAEIGKSAAF